MRWFSAGTERLHEQMKRWCGKEQLGLHILQTQLSKWASETSTAQRTFKWTVSCLLWWGSKVFHLLNSGVQHTHTPRKVDQGAGLSTALKDSSKDPVWGVLEEEGKPPRGQPSWDFCFKLLKLGLLFLLEAFSQVPNVLALPLHQANYNSLHFILVLESISSLGLGLLDHPNFSFHSAYLTCC